MQEHDTIQLYEAIRQMRILTGEEKTFSFSYSTYNRDTMQSHGNRVVHRARLRPAAKEDDVRHAGHKIFYFDMDQQKPQTVWQVLILTFQNMKVIL